MTNFTVSILKKGSIYVFPFYFGLRSGILRLGYETTNTLLMKT